MTTLYDDIIPKKLQNIEGQVVELDHPYVRYVDPEQGGAARNKDTGEFGTDVSASDAAHSVSDYITTAKGYGITLPDGLPKRKIIGQVCDAENPHDDDEPVSEFYVFGGKAIVNSLAVPLSVVGRMLSDTGK